MKLPSVHRIGAIKLAALSLVKKERSLLSVGVILALVIWQTIIVFTPNSTLSLVVFIGVWLAILYLLLRSRKLANRHSQSLVRRVEPYLPPLESPTLNTPFRVSHESLGDVTRFVWSVSRYVEVQTEYECFVLEIKIPREKYFETS